MKLDKWKTHLWVLQTRGPWIESWTNEVTGDQSRFRGRPRWGIQYRIYPFYLRLAFLGKVFVWC